MRHNQSDSESSGNTSLHDDSDRHASDGGSNPESNAFVDEGESIESLRKENLYQTVYILVKCHSTKK